MDKKKNSVNYSKGLFVQPSKIKKVSYSLDSDSKKLLKELERLRKLL